ncbi:MAG: fluoride efflux transporter CrcB [Chloroflexi bacterium]|nr:fluoride efflux transporter CrcB [Chloroflexota bacterium]
MPILLIALGGAAGAVARYAMDVTIATRLDGAFPWGTFAVNLTGSFALGLLFALVVEREVLPAATRGPLLIGFLGAFTTFSTLMLESWRLWEDGAVMLALGNLVGSMVLGVVALVAGLALGRALA